MYTYIDMIVGVKDGFETDEWELSSLFEVEVAVCLKLRQNI